MRESAPGARRQVLALYAGTPTVFSVSLVADVASALPASLLPHELRAHLGRSAQRPPPPLVLSGHAASLTPY